MQKNNLPLIVVLLTVLIVGYTVMYKDKNSTTPDNKGINGRVVFSVTDAAANMGNITEVNIQLDGLEIRRANGTWEKVSSAPKAFNLLALKSQGRHELFADVEQEVGTYDKVHFEIKSVGVTTKDGKTHLATVPSGGLEMNTNLVVRHGETSSLAFDFLADKSLFTASTGEYVFAPVVKADSKSGVKLSFGANNAVLVESGSTDDSRTVGMKLDGSIKADFQLSPTQKIELKDLIKVQSN